MASSALQMQGRVGSKLRKTRLEPLMLPDSANVDIDKWKSSYGEPEVLAALNKSAFRAPCLSGKGHFRLQPAQVSLLRWEMSWGRLWASTKPHKSGGRDSGSSPHGLCGSLERALRPPFQVHSQNLVTA
jgi:hypothetical protein